jgi:hypothetical protein
MIRRALSGLVSLAMCACGGIVVWNLVFADTPTEPVSDPTSSSSSAAEPAPRRLENGTLINKPSGGAGKLAINNGGSLDAAVFLAKGGKTKVAVYVRKISSFTVDRIPDGRYEIYVVSGSDWDSAAKKFTRSASRFVFDDPAFFETSAEEGSTTYSISITPVAGGNANTHQVDEGSFPSG